MCHSCQYLVSLAIYFLQLLIFFQDLLCLHLLFVEQNVAAYAQQFKRIVINNVFLVHVIEPLKRASEVVHIPVLNVANTQEGVDVRKLFLLPQDIPECMECFNQFVTEDEFGTIFDFLGVL